MLANLAPFFCFSFFFFGVDGHFGDITKLAIEDTKKKNKERKKEKNHHYYYYLIGVYTRNVVYTKVLKHDGRQSLIGGCLQTI